MQKIKVLFVVLQLDAGGSERVVFDLARSLEPDKFEVFVAAFKDGVMAEPLKKICSAVFIVDKKRKLDIGAMFKLANIVRKYHIDIVNAHHYMPCFYSYLGTSVLNAKSLIYTEHSVPEVENIVSGVHGIIFHWMLYRISAVVGVSRAITEKFKEHYPRHTDKFHEILNAVDIDKFQANGTRDDVRARWGLTKDDFVVGTVANFRKIKNHACLVRAAGRVKDSHPQLRLFFVGTGFTGDTENSEDEVRSLIRELGIQDKVVFAGYQENIPEMLSAFDAFCLPSLSEGLPVSLLEAMAAGIPVIGSDVKGIIEVVKDGNTGILFASNNDSDLSSMLKYILDTPSIVKTLTNNARSYVKNNHNIELWRKKYTAILDTIDKI